MTFEKRDIAVRVIYVYLVQFVYAAPKLLYTLEVFNSTSKYLGHIVHMYVCKMNQIVKLGYVS